MKPTRVHKKRNWTAADRARHKAIREKFQKEKPSLEQLTASGDYLGPIQQGALMKALETAAALREAREAAGLSLSEVARRSGIDKAALSRLETGRQSNPTIDTLWRYAIAIGKSLVISIQDDAADPHTGKQARKRSRQPTPVSSTAKP